MSDTPQSILHVAADLFENDGYSATTMSRIAQAAHISLTDLETLYTCKESIVLDLYRSFAEEMQQSIPTIGAGHVAHRYFKFMEARITQLQSHYEAMAALFAIAMLPHSHLSTKDISPGRRDAIYQAFLLLIAGSEDAPSDDEVDNLAMLLYTFHFMILVFWAYDRTKDKQATHLLIDFMGDFFRVMRPMMMMPVFRKAMNKLAKIMMLVFGGARLIDDEESTDE
jgi:AcrR family transcriptional regulator